MANDLSRDDVNGLSARIRQILDDHQSGKSKTERTRNDIEQVIADAAGQLSEEDRRSVAQFAERLIASVWSDSMSIEGACIKVEHVAVAAAANAHDFPSLIADIQRQ